MNTIPQTLAQLFQLPRGGAERTRPAPQPTVSPGKILNGATIYSPVRFLNGLTGAGTAQAHLSPVFHVPVPLASLSFPTGIYSFFLSFPRRRESRSLWQIGAQIASAGIHILDQIHLPRHSPFLDLFLAFDSLFHVPVSLIARQPMYSVPLRLLAMIYT